MQESMQATPPLALKPRVDITRSPKHWYHFPHKKDICPPQNLKTKQKNVHCHCQRCVHTAIIVQDVCNSPFTLQDLHVRELSECKLYHDSAYKLHTTEQQFAGDVHRSE